MKAAAVRGGRPDAQARIVKVRTPSLVSRMLASHANGQTWMPKGSDHDPRIYAGSTSPASVAKMLRAFGIDEAMVPSVSESARWPLPIAPARIPKAAASAFGNFIADKIPDEADFSWRRDVAEWLKGRGISPDKLRRMCEALDESWIVSFCDVGYYQHLVVLMDKLLRAKRYRELTIVAAFLFTQWSSRTTNLVERLAVMDLAQNLLTELGQIGSAWLREGGEKEVPAFVFIDDIHSQALRCVFRLCDPVENDPAKIRLCDPIEKNDTAKIRLCNPTEHKSTKAGNGKTDALLYPRRHAIKASAHILRDIIQTTLHIDFFDAALLLPIVCGEDRATSLAATRQTNKPRRDGK